MTDDIIDWDIVKVTCCFQGETRQQVIIILSNLRGGAGLCSMSHLTSTLGDTRGRQNCSAVVQMSFIFMLFVVVVPAGSSIKDKLLCFQTAFLLSFAIQPIPKCVYANKIMKS